MKRHGSVLALVVLAAVTMSAAGSDQKFKTPRNEYGAPDLQGIWNFSSDIPLERPMKFADQKFFTPEELRQQIAGRSNALSLVAKIAPVEAAGVNWLDYGAQIENLRTSLITYPENGRLPKLVEGVRRNPGVDDFIAALNDSKGTVPPALLAAFGGGKKDGYQDLGGDDRCLGGSGSPLVPTFDNNYLQIVQAKATVALLTEAFHYARIVPLDDRPRPGEKLRTWSGLSRGHWEGETLVVETTNFNNRTQSFAGAGRSAAKVVTERFTRVGKDAIEYEATVVDPKTFQDKVVITYPMARVDTRIFENACHEGNYSLPAILAGARREEASRRDNAE